MKTTAITIAFITAIVAIATSVNVFGKETFERSCKEGKAITSFFTEFIPDEGYGQAPTIAKRSFTPGYCRITVESEGTYETYYVSDKKDGRLVSNPSYLGTLEELEALR